MQVHGGPLCSPVDGLDQTGVEALRLLLPVFQQPASQCGLENHRERACHGGEIGDGRLDYGALRLEPVERPLRRNDALGIRDWVADLLHPTDSETLDAREGQGVRGRSALAEGVAPIEAPQRVEQEADIADAPRHRADVGIGRTEIQQVEVRYHAERCLEACDAAAGGRNPDRSASVASERERDLSARERRIGTSARTAAGRIGVEGIERAIEERAVG